MWKDNEITATAQGAHGNPQRLVKCMYFAKDVPNPNHSDRLLRALRHLNSYAISIENE